MKIAIFLLTIFCLTNTHQQAITADPYTPYSKKPEASAGQNVKEFTEGFVNGVFVGSIITAVIDGAVNTGLSQQKAKIPASGYLGFVGGSLMFWWSGLGAYPKTFAQQLGCFVGGMTPICIALYFFYT